MDLSKDQAKKLKSAYEKGELEVRSVSPEGNEEWKTVSRVAKTFLPWERCYELTTSKGDKLKLTGGHRIYQTPLLKKEAEKFSKEDSVLCMTDDGDLYTQEIISSHPVSGNDHYYDIKVEENHNFRVDGSDVVVTNSPDRNYHWHPPTSSGTVNEFNEAFGHVWEDDELVEYMERAVDTVNLHPPATELHGIERMINARPAWRQYILMGAVSYAAMALQFNWTVEEFNYNIGGMSLDIDKSSKYQTLASDARQKFENYLEKKRDTVNIVRGLRQSRYGQGVRSSFGPITGHNTLTPRKYMGV